MTQQPSGNPNAGRINRFPTKTSQPFLSQSILSQPILSQSRGAPQAGGGDDPWLVDTAGIGAANRNESAQPRRAAAGLY